MNRFSYVPTTDELEMVNYSSELDSVIGNERFSRFLGRRYSAEDVWEGYCSSIGVNEEQFKNDAEGAKIWNKCRYVRAWSIPSLQGMYLSAKNSDDLFTQIPMFLEQHLGPVKERENWSIDLSHSERQPEETPLCKYGLLHTCVPFGVSSGTRQPTVIELSGYIVSVGNKSLSSPEERWLWLVEQFWTRYENICRPIINETIEVHVLGATWANIFASHIGIPFYL